MRFRVHSVAHGGQGRRGRRSLAREGFLELIACDPPAPTPGF